MRAMEGAPRVVDPTPRADHNPKSESATIAISCAVDLTLDFRETCETAVSALVFYLDMEDAIYGPISNAARFGVVEVLSELALGERSDWHEFAVAGCRLDLAPEAIVLRHRSQFSAEVINAAQRRLLLAEILPSCGAPLKNELKWNADTA